MIENKIYKNVSLKKFNTWKVGGYAENYIEISSQDYLIDLLQNKKIKLPLIILGLGSNTLIRDKGIRGTVLNFSKKMKLIEENENYIYAQSGLACSVLARYAARNKKKNSAFLAGIPGTIGGALAMNAGCYGNEIWDFVKQVKVINLNGEVSIKDQKSFKIEYRSVCNPDNDMFLGAWFKFPDLTSSDIPEEEKIKKFLQNRKNSQPLNFPTAGSTFRNPNGYFAAALIESAGLKGYQIGGAKVSQKHANFIENTGKATASEIEKLIYFIQSKIKEINGIDLELEVKIIGD
jgi:UDP-N-acetylmuramate dehydrogenase